MGVRVDFPSAVERRQPPAPRALAVLHDDELVFILGELQSRPRTAVVAMNCNRKVKRSLSQCGTGELFAMLQCRGICGCYLTIPRCLPGCTAGHGQFNDNTSSQVGLMAKS